MWHVLVPVKGGGAAKSRLDLDPRRRQALADAMAGDTLQAVMSCAAVAQVTVLCGPHADLALPSGAVRLVEPDAVQSAGNDGLNTHLGWALDLVAEDRPAAGPVAVVVADLPALTSRMLDRVLAAAGETESGIVVDRHGLGTTVLTAMSGGAGPRPRFGPRSAAVHLAAGAVALDAAPGVRCDVDTLDDLREATALGVGPRTMAVLAAGVH